MINIYIIDNINKSVGILSNETLVAQHPWVDDVSLEKERIEKEKAEAEEQYGLAFNPMQNKGKKDENTGNSDKAKDGMGGDE
jgi:hypothetical protein